MYLFIVPLLLLNCTKTEIKEVEKIVTVTETETLVTTQIVTNTVTVVNSPEEYSFTRNGISTVFYTGQTDRLKMATELKTALNLTSSSQTKLNNMFNNGTDFSDPLLNASGKKVGNKTAASDPASATVKPLFDGWITEFTSVVIPAVNSSIIASSGVAGSIANSGASRTVKVNSKGLELNQVFSKGLIGALQVDQIVNKYLSFAKLESSNARQDNDGGIKGYKLSDQVTNTITRMEHYWDEGFGYLQGLDNQYSPGLGDPSVGRDTANLNYYLRKVNAQTNEAGITKRIYDAFIFGRAAIVAKKYDERDRQAAIISAELSKVIGYKAQSYLRDAAEIIDDTDVVEWADALHALSEAYGFILGLQFTKTSDGTPYLTNAEVNELLDELSAGTGGFWDRTPAELRTMADELQQITGLSVPE